MSTAADTEWAASSLAAHALRQHADVPPAGQTQILAASLARTLAAIVLGMTSPHLRSVARLYALDDPGPHAIIGSPWRASASSSALVHGLSAFEAMPARHDPNAVDSIHVQTTIAGIAAVMRSDRQTRGLDLLRAVGSGVEVASVLSRSFPLAADVDVAGAVGLVASVVTIGMIDGLGEEALGRKIELAASLPLAAAAGNFGVKVIRSAYAAYGPAHSVRIDDYAAVGIHAPDGMIEATFGSTFAAAGAAPRSVSPSWPSEAVEDLHGAIEGWLSAALSKGHATEIAARCCAVAESDDVIAALGVISLGRSGQANAEETG